MGFFVWRVFSGFESFVFKSLFYHSLWVWWWLNHFVSWENVVFHEGDCFGCMFLILVGWLSWLDVFYFYKTLTFWSCFQLSLYTYIYIYIYFFFFWEERDIKWEQKYIFTPIFNRGGLQETNWLSLRWAKWHFSNHG